MEQLPEEIQAILKRKSSRDPNTRFTAKLHVLLSFVQSHPDREDSVGCCWVSDDEFRINKHVLCDVMGIKVNTLNVNLKDLGFVQRKYSRDGWTLWNHPSFNRLSPDPMPQAPGAFTPRIDCWQLPFSLGRMRPDDVDRFRQSALELWSELGDAVVPVGTFVPWAAGRFRQPEQPIGNAADVVRAIVPVTADGRITIGAFARFLAMFGPAPTIMIKIAGLLTSSEKHGQWLSLQPVDQAAQPQLSGMFDDKEPNCLVLRALGKPAVRVWNLPLVEASDPYVTDERGRLWRGWEVYFKENPPPDPFAFA
jgi:hypothetical protein